ncbi:MAG: DNA repair protein RadC [Bacteroidales bacterium]|nr:DNA repair protein RadC [Bacteroidales bacterium]MBR3577258.1 DNA repair protein RadC [Bacteroidales bacterium]MBR4647599.1 DNA repair protein RadC [Bacteroidales bacterium]
MCANSYLPNLSIPEWSVSDRPREKYLTHGADHLGDAELLAILLRTGTSQESAVDLAKRILAANGNSLNRLSEMSVEELTRIKGIGKVKAVTLQAAFELGRRRRAALVEEKKKIGSVDDVIELMQSRLADAQQEQFWTIFLNNASSLLLTQCIGTGNLTKTIVDVRKIIQKALDLGATGLILCHNHPSGNLKPSREDLELTLTIRKAAQLFNLEVKDHVIIHKSNGYSFLEEGLL